MKTNPNTATLLNRIQALLMPLLLCWMTAAGHAAERRMVFHELANHSPQSTYINYFAYPRISGNGQKIVYAHQDAVTNRYRFRSINFDGTGGREIDYQPATATGYFHSALSADGSMYAWTNGQVVRYASTSGSVGTEMFRMTNAPIGGLAFSDDGTKLYVLVINDDVVAGVGSQLWAGLWEIPVGVNTIQQRRVILSKTFVARDLKIDIKEVWGFNDYTGVAVSQNAQRLVCSFSTLAAGSSNTFTQRVVGVNLDGTGIHQIGGTLNNAHGLAISADGSKVGILHANSTTGVNQAVVANFDGSGLLTVATNTVGSFGPISLTANGSHILLQNGWLHRTDGVSREYLFHAYNSIPDGNMREGAACLMARDGRRFSYVEGGISRLNCLEIDPASLGAAPNLTQPSATPGFVVYGSTNYTTSTVKVTATFPGVSDGVDMHVFEDGGLDTANFWNTKPYNDGPGGGHGDVSSTDSIFTNNGLATPYPDANALGPKTLRFAAQSRDASNLRHSTIIDYVPFTVLSSAPAGSAPSISSLSPASGLAGARVTINGTNFNGSRTGNTVTMNGYGVEIVSANVAGTQIVFDVPTWFGNGSYNVVVNARGQSSAAAVFTIGTATAPEIAVEQPAGAGIADGGSKDFGSVSTSGNASLTFTIKNTGNANLTGLTITKDGTNSADFTVTANPTAPVSGPSGSTTFTVRFAPTTSGAKTAALHIANNDSNENPYDITLTGTGTTVAAPEIAVEQPAGTGLADGGSRSFGNVNTGSNASLTFTIKNTGNASLTGLTITKDGTNSADFTVTTNPTSPVSGPSGSTTFIVRFAPTTSGVKSALIHIASNDADENPFDLTLTGVATAVAVPDINVTPTSLAFGTVTVGSTLSNNITVANTGGATLNVSAITSSNARYTVVSPTVPFSVAAGGSQVVSIRFAPTTAATENGTLSIASNDTDENPVNIALGGTGGAVAGVAAVMTSPANGSTLTAAATTFSWSAGTGVTQYWLYVGSATGGNDLYTASEGTNRTRMVTLPTDGRVIYVTLWSQINGAWQTNSYTYTCSSAAKPVKAQLIAPVNGSTLTTTTPTFTWNAGVGCAEYWLYVGTAVGGSDLYNSTTGTALSRTVTVPATGAKIYVTLWSRINGGWVNSTYLFTTQSPARAVLTGSANGSTLANGNLNLTWSAGTGVTGYWVYVGSTVGGSDLGNYSAGTTRSLNVNVPSDGGPIYVTLWSQINGGWQTESYWFNTALPVSGSIAARLTGPANTSTLGSTSVSFTWNAGTGVTQRDLWVGSKPDGFDLYKGSNEAGLSRTLNLPGDGRRIYVTLHSLIGPSWISNAYYFTAVTATQLQAAQITSPVNGQNIATSSLALTWSSVAGASSYYLYVGSSPTTADLYTGSQGTSLSRTVTVPTDGRPVYVTLWSQVGGAWLQNNYWFTTPNTVTGNQKAYMTTPTNNGSVLPGATATFAWTSGVGVTNYALYVGSTPNSSDLYSATSNTIRSRTLTLPTDGRKIYVTLWSVVNGVWQSNSYLYTAANVSLAGAAMTSPAPGTIYTSATVNFAWSAGTGATQYWLSVSRTPWGGEIYSGSQGTNRNKTITTMPTDGSPIYVKLQSLINGVWQSSEHIYQAPIL